MKLEITIDPTSLQLAEAFAEMADEDQAQFFIHVAAIMDGWPRGSRVMQAHYIGRHMRKCPCATPEARELVRDIAEAFGEAP